MELLYKTSVPLGRVNCISWSRLNLIGLSVSVQTEGLIAKGYEGASTHQLLVFDPNRPWELHTVASDYRSEVFSLVWSMDGSRLLALSRDSSIRVWRMKTNCINNWVCANKIESGGNHNDDTVHVGWLDYRPMVTIHHSKETWTEVMETQPVSPHLRMLLGSAFISVLSSGKVRVDSISLSHIDTSGELKAEVQLATNRRITIARSYVTQTGTILCGVGCENGQVKVFSLSASLCWGNEFTLTATLATELHQMSSQPEEIRSMLMLPLSDGCEVHLCCNKNQLYKWSVKDMTRSGSYQSRREGSYSSTHSVSSLVGSSLCLGSHDLTVTENKMSELLVFGDEDMMKVGEGKWPTEIVVCGSVSGEVTVFGRETCKALVTEMEGKEDGVPVTKRRRIDQVESSSERHDAGNLVAISPNACCLAVARGGSIVLYQLGRIVLGLKDTSNPEVPRCSRLLSLSLVSGQSSWDLAITCSRLQTNQDVGFVGEVLKHFSNDFERNSSTLRSLLLQQYYSVCTLLQSCKDDCLLPSLTHRHMSRLNATNTLFALSLPTQRDEESGVVERLGDLCLENISEEKLEDLVNDLELKDYSVSTSISSCLQGHCHWLVELAIKTVAAVVRQEKSICENVPDGSSLKLLRQCLVLIYIWNKVLSQPIIPITDRALSLLFKVITTYIQSPNIPFPEELQKEISTNIPIEKHPNLLSLSKAARLQGFLSGLAEAELPETFIRGKPCRIRPSVQSKYTSLDPYSPLTLVVPKGLSPPWRDCFIEGQRDIVHGGSLTKAVVQNAKLKQCSRCRSWTVASEGLQGDQISSLTTSHPIQQWRSAWSTGCLCGAPWTISTSKRT